MNVDTVLLDRNTAGDKLRTIRKALKKLHHQKAEKTVINEYKILARVYRKLEKGDRILDIQKAIPSVGFTAQGFPRVAIARADSVRTILYWEKGAQIAKFHSAPNHWRHHYDIPRTHVFKIDMGTPRDLSIERLVRIATTPKIPIELREDHNLAGLAILWEVENWLTINQSPLAADRDPFLLLPLGGPFYKIIAEWDLTDIELALAKHALIVDR